MIGTSNRFLRVMSFLISLSHFSRAFAVLTVGHPGSCPWSGPRHLTVRPRMRWRLCSLTEASTHPPGAAVRPSSRTLLRGASLFPPPPAGVRRHIRRPLSVISTRYSRHGRCSQPLHGGQLRARLLRPLAQGPSRPVGATLPIVGCSLPGGPRPPRRLPRDGLARGRWPRAPELRRGRAPRLSHLRRPSRRLRSIPMPELRL